VLLDTETTGLEKTDTVIEIAVISAAQGTTLLNTRIQTDQPIREEATYRHHLTESDLQSAPSFSEVWAGLLAIFNQTQTIICYSADFHREKLMWTAQHYGFALPKVEWQCLMVRYATFYGKVRLDDPVCPFQWQELSQACKQQGTQGGQSPRSLAQVQRARRLLQALAKKKGKHYE
jgi:DNA polymerase III epsilon subunit-like protein